MALIRQVQRTGVTIFLIEHVMQAVLGLSDKVLVRNHGENIAAGPPQEVATEPQGIAASLGSRHENVGGRLSVLRVEHLVVFDGAQKSRPL